MADTTTTRRSGDRSLDRLHLDPRPSTSDRTRDLASLAARALRTREQTAAGERLVFADRPVIERELRAVIAAEASCCAFLTMDLERTGDGLVLDIAGPQDARPIIAELFRVSVPERLLGAGALVMALCCARIWGDWRWHPPTGRPSSASTRCPPSRGEPDGDHISVALA